MRKGPARGPFIHIGSGGLICTDPTVPQNEEFRAYLEEKMSTAPDRQPMPIGVADCSLQRTDRQLWVDSGILHGGNCFVCYALQTSRKSGDF